MNFHDLLRENIEKELQIFSEHAKEMTNLQLTATASNPLSDYRMIMAAKQELRERGVEGVPE